MIHLEEIKDPPHLNLEFSLMSTYKMEKNLKNAMLKKNSNSLLVTCHPA